MGLQMHEDNFQLAAVLAEWLLQLAAELILMQTEPVVKLGPQSSEMFAALVREKSKSLLLLLAAVAGLVLGSFVQHVVAQLTVQYLLQLEPVAHLAVSSYQHWPHVGC